MGDMPCIYKMNLIDENKEVEQDLLSGRALDILICMMSGEKNAKELAREVGIAIYSVQLYLQRLIKAGMIVITDERITNGQLERIYKLSSDNLEILNYIKENKLSDIEKKQKLSVSAEHFAYMTKSAIKNVNSGEELPYKIKAYFMKAKKSDMEAFKQEIDDLYKKYQNLEDTDAEDTYSLFEVLAPYKIN